MPRKSKNDVPDGQTRPISSYFFPKVSSSPKVTSGDLVALEAATPTSIHSTPSRSNGDAAGTDHSPILVENKRVENHERAMTPPRSTRTADLFESFNGYDDRIEEEGYYGSTGFSVSQQSVGSPGLHANVNRHDQDSSLNYYEINSSPSGETLRRLTLSPRKKSPSSSRAKRRRDVQTLVPGTPSKSDSGTSQFTTMDRRLSIGRDNIPLERPASSFMSRLALATAADENDEGQGQGRKKEKRCDHPMNIVHDSSSDSEPRRRRLLAQPRPRPLKPRVSRKNDSLSPSPAAIASTTPCNVVVYGSDSESEKEWQDKETTPVPQPTDGKPTAALSDIDERDLSMTSPLHNLSISPSLRPLRSETQKHNSMLLSDEEMITLESLTKTGDHGSDSSSSSDLDDPFGDPLLSDSSTKENTFTAESPSRQMTIPKKDLPTPELDLMLTDDELPPLPHEQRSRSGRVIKTRATVPTKARFKPPAKKKATFSLDLLYDGKDKSGALSVDISRQIEEALNGQVLEEFDADEEEELLFGAGTTKIIPKDVLSEEQQEVLTEVLAEDEIELVEDAFEFFAHWPQQRRILPRLDRSLSAPTSQNPFMERVFKSLEIPGMYKPFLLSPFMHILLRSEWEMPRVLYSWMVDVMALETDFAVVNSISAILQHAARRPTASMVVRPDDLARVCQYYGAKDDVMKPQWTLAPVTKDTKPQRVLDARSSPFPKENLVSVITLVHECALARPSDYQYDEIRTMVNTLLRIVTDPIVGDIKTNIGAAISSLLNAIPEVAREEQRKILVKETIHTFGESLPFMLLIMSYWPATNAWTMLVRRSIAVVYLGLTPIPPGSNKPELSQIQDFIFDSPAFVRNDKTDYKKMSNIIRMLGYCLDDDKLIASYGTKALRELVLVLRQLHGKIVDVRAAFMDRTIAKDALQRLFTRLFYAGVHRSGSRQSTLNYAPQSSTGADTLKGSDIMQTQTPTSRSATPTTPHVPPATTMDILTPAEATIFDMALEALSAPTKGGDAVAAGAAQADEPALESEEKTSLPPRASPCSSQSSQSHSDRYVTPEPMPGSPDSPL